MSSRNVYNVKELMHVSDIRKECIHRRVDIKHDKNTTSQESMSNSSKRKEKKACPP